MFHNWQYSVIETLKYGPITINSVIHLFIKDAITPFLSRFGYLLEQNSEFGDVIASVIFRFHNVSRYYMFPTRENISFDDDIYEYFDTIINEEEWNSFFAYWDYNLGNLFDFKNDGRLAIQIRDIIWMYIDLEKSLTHIDYMEKIKKDEEELLEELKEQKKKLDPYILEQKNSFIHPKFIFEK